MLPPFGFEALVLESVFLPAALETVLVPPLLLVTVREEVVLPLALVCLVEDTRLPLALSPRLATDLAPVFLSTVTCLDAVADRFDTVF